MIANTIQWILIVQSLLQLCTHGHENMDKRSGNRWLATNEQTDSNSRDIQCPPADVIEPCSCSVEDDNMDMYCSALESEEQMASVFAHEFPFLHFRKLTIIYNRNLKVLKAGALGNTTYRIISITHGVLQEVEQNALALNYDTTEDIKLSYNHIEFFPFAEINHFTKLTNLAMYSNNLNGFPAITSSSITNLNMGNNDYSFDNIDSEALQQVQQLEYLSVRESGLTEIYEGTFTQLPRLGEVDLGTNQLTHLPDGIIDCNENPNSKIYLNSNAIASVAPNAIAGVRGFIAMANNLMTEVEEVVWRKHFEQGVRFNFDENPLNCGCDLAWLILNSTFMDLLTGNTKCADGQLLTDLDPDSFANLC